VSDFPTLLSPLRIGRIDLRNRVALLPQGTGLNRDGVPSDADIAYYEARAAGGVGLVICGGTAAHPSSQLRNRTVLEAYNEAAVPALAKRVDAVHRHGAAIMGQLLCLGREMAAEAMELAPVAPSALRSSRFAYGPHALSRAEIDEHVASYAASAANLLAAGHDGVEIHAAHGYLVAQFLSPATNHRDDEYGVTDEGRLRFLVDIIRAVRARCGTEVMLGVRLSIDEEIAGGITIEDSIGIISALDRLDAVDYLSLTVGVRGGYVKDMSAPHGVAIDRIAAVRHATRLPIIAAQRIITPELAESIVASGTADLSACRARSSPTPSGWRRPRVASPPAFARASVCHRSAAATWPAGSRAR
jgi:2,4-dienoyl-CoA reductase (NADPH2)